MSPRRIEPSRLFKYDEYAAEMKSGSADLDRNRLSGTPFMQDSPFQARRLKKNQTRACKCSRVF